MPALAKHNQPFRPALISFTLLITILCSFFFNTPTHAQQNKALDEVRELATWSQEYSGIMDDLFALFDIDQLNVILEHANDIEASGLEPFEQAVKLWSENLDVNIEKIEKRTANLAEPPKVTFSKKTNKANKDSKEQIETVVNSSIESALHLKTAFGRLAKGDDSGVTEILIAQQDAAGIAIRAEIAMINSALIAIPKSNPNRQFQLLILADDKYALSELELTKLSILDTSTLEARTPYIIEMENQVEISKSLIAPGLAAIAKTNASLEREIKLRPSTAKINQDAIDIMNTFTESFEVEAGITQSKSDAINHYKLDKPVEDIDLLIEQTDARYFELLERRFTLFDQRLAMIANMGK